MNTRPILFLILLCVACSKPKSEFEQLLMEPGKKWVYIEEETLNHPYGAIAYTKFHEKTCENRHLGTNDIFPVSIEGNNPPGKWNYNLSKKTLNMFGQYFFTITKFSPDTIYMVNQKNKQKGYFINYGSRK